MSAGYVYLLINPSMDGIVKIGKTERDPENRVSELSSATGVPTSFILVYKQYFNNCSEAELAIHTALHSHRVAANREFFKIPIYEAIEVIKYTPDSQQYMENNAGTEKGVYSNNNNVPYIAYEFLKQGIDFYFGNDDNLQDFGEAMDYFERARKLGTVEPYKYLGMMYQYGSGCKQSVEKAIKYFKDGASKGNNHCYSLLGNIYLTDVNYKHIENGLKCYESYFKNIDIEFAFDEDITNFMYYLVDMRRTNNMIKYQEILGIYKNRILNRIDKEISNYCKWYSDDKSLRDFLVNELEEIKNNIEINIIEKEIPFLKAYVEIDDLFYISGRGVVFTGTVKYGTIRVGDSVEIKGRNFNVNTTISGIETYRKLLDYANEGDNVGILIKGGNREDFLFVYDKATILVK